MITIIAYHPEGFEIRFEQPDLDKLQTSVDWLVKKGYRPQLGFQYTPEGLPICPRHGLPMTKREKQGDTWYSHNVGNEDNPRWCRGYAHNSSPGWDAGRQTPETPASKPNGRPPAEDEATAEMTVPEINDLLFS
jgi:hypothetical protein